MKKVFFLIIFLAFYLSSGNLYADGKNPNETASSSSDSEILRKIEKLVETQNKILSTLEDIKAELQVIKVRASQG